MSPLVVQSFIYEDLFGRFYDAELRIPQDGDELGSVGVGTVETDDHFF